MCVCSTSSQKLNVSKPRIIFFNIKRSVMRDIQNYLGFEVAETPCKYLGIPFFQGIGKAAYWSSIIQNIRDRIAAWKAR